MTPGLPTGRACTRRCSTTASSKDTGVTTLDFAKAMIDEGFHPMTMYFPLVVHGAMLIEPTETEAKEELDLFIATLRCAGRARQGRRRPSDFKAAPRFAPRRRLDETRRRASRCCAGGPRTTRRKVIR